MQDSNILWPLVFPGTVGTRLTIQSVQAKMLVVIQLAKCIK